jgi:hypothetical protein
MYLRVLFDATDSDIALDNPLGTSYESNVMLVSVMDSDE